MTQKADSTSPNKVTELLGEHVFSSRLSCHTLLKRGDERPWEAQTL